MSHNLKRGLKCGFTILGSFRFFHRRICGACFYEEKYGTQGRFAKKRWGKQQCFIPACSLVDYFDDSLGNCEHGACCVVVFG